MILRWLRRLASRKDGNGKQAEIDRLEKSFDKEFICIVADKTTNGICNNI